VNSLLAVLGVLLADARRHRLQTLASCLGVTVGVAVIVGIRLSSEAALGNLRSTLGALGGRATHEITAREPMPAARLADCLASDGVLAAQPLVECTLVARGPEGPLPLRLVGIDPFLAAPFLDLDAELPLATGGQPTWLRLLVEPGLVALDERTVAKLGQPADGLIRARGPRGEVSFQALPLPPSSLGTSEPPFVLADLATAQELLGIGARVTRIELQLDEQAPPPPLQAGERLQRPERRGERAASMTAAFRMNLLCLGFLAVLVGAFLAYNMAQFAVVRRRALMGRLRCLGCTARGLMVGVLLEAAVLGLLGSSLGILGGRLLARVLVADVARTVSTLYGHIGTPRPELDLGTAALALLVGVSSTVAACWAPARSAARTSPALVAGHAFTREPLPSALRAAALAVASGLLLLPEHSAVLLPALAILGLLLAVAASLPWLLGIVVRRAPRAPVLALAFGRIQRSLGRAGSAAGALTMPLAMTIAILVMVGSLRAELGAWSEGVLGADIYVKPLFQELQPDVARLSDELLQALAELPQVAAIDRLRLTRDEQAEHAFLVAGSPLEAPRARGTMRLLDGGPLDTLLARVDAGELLASEPLARRLGLSPGDRLVLNGREGPATMTVAGVFQDYSWDQGYALLSEARYLALFGDTGVRNAALLLREGEDASALAQTLADRFEEAEFRPVQQLREEIFGAFDDTFAITYVLQAISTVLALVGTLTALLCLHLERRAELGVLRALGARHGTIGGLLLSEAGVLLGTAGLCAVPTGLVLAWILVSVVNTRSFGWSFPMLVQAGPLFGLLALALGAGLLASVVPWWQARRTQIAALLEDAT